MILLFLPSINQSINHMRLYRKNLFPDVFQFGFLHKIQQYHDETNLPIYVALKFLPQIPHPSGFLSNMKQHLAPHHKIWVKEYLPPTVFKMARQTYRRYHYHHIKAKRLFVEQALEQIRDYDEFYLTMDDIHEMDSVMTTLFYQELYYRE